MNTKNVILLSAVFACLIVGGAVARGGEASVAELIVAIKSADEPARVATDI